VARSVRSYRSDGESSLPVPMPCLHACERAARLGVAAGRAACLHAGKLGDDATVHALVQVAGLGVAADDRLEGGDSGGAVRGGSAHARNAAAPPPKWSSLLTYSRLASANRFPLEPAIAPFSGVTLDLPFRATLRRRKTRADNVDSPRWSRDRSGGRSGPAGTRPSAEPPAYPPLRAARAHAPGHSGDFPNPRAPVEGAFRQTSAAGAPLRRIFR